ncbi:hypothetical protein NMR58_003319, partial [Vibrio cholerae]|nr:hypothetical protein [Vibrio cholerae]
QEIKKVVDALDRKVDRIIFSPAHIEEISDVIRHHGQPLKRAHDKLDFLKNLTESYCLLPYPNPYLRPVRNNGINTYQEDPYSTFSRVYGKSNRNIFPEQHQREKLERGERIESENVVNNDDTKIDPIEILEKYKTELVKIVNLHHKIMRRNLTLKEFVPSKKITLSMIKYEYLKNYFPLLEMVIEKAMENLEYNRYYPDLSAKYVASMHDTTHAIYGAYTDVFVTNDGNFAKKVEAVYKWLGVKTKVMTRQQFIEIELSGSATA